MDIKEIDMRGQICPSSLLLALREISSNKVVLKARMLSLVFLTDNRDATVTIPDSAASMGYETTVTREDNYYRITIFAAAN